MEISHLATSIRDNQTSLSVQIYIISLLQKWESTLRYKTLFPKRQIIFGYIKSTHPNYYHIILSEGKKIKAACPSITTNSPSEPSSMIFIMFTRLAVKEIFKLGSTAVLQARMEHLLPAFSIWYGITWVSVRAASDFLQSMLQWHYGTEPADCAILWPVDKKERRYNEAVNKVHKFDLYVEAFKHFWQSCI